MAKRGETEKRRGELFAIRPTSYIRVALNVTNAIRVFTLTSSSLSSRHAYTHFPRTQAPFNHPFLLPSLSAPPPRIFSLRSRDSGGGAYEARAGTETERRRRRHRRHRLRAREIPTFFPTPVSSVVEGEQRELPAPTRTHVSTRDDAPRKCVRSRKVGREIGGAGEAQRDEGCGAARG